jgi:hypothetical protein
MLINVHIQGHSMDEFWKAPAEAVQFNPEASENRKTFSVHIFCPIPDESGMPAMLLVSLCSKRTRGRYRELATVCSELIQLLDGSEMKVTAHRFGEMWRSLDAMTWRREKARIPPSYYFPELTPKAIDLLIRAEAQPTQNIDKGFDRFIRKFNEAEPVSIQDGLHGEHGWGIYFQQGKRRCVLKGKLFGDFVN